MKVLDFLAKVAHIHPSDVPGFAITDDGRKCRLNGLELIYNQPMLHTQDGLLRFGRHMWLVGWDDIEIAKKKLTVNE